MFTKTMKRWIVGMSAAAAAVGLVLVSSGNVTAKGPGGPAGVDIKIRAQNRSISDTPFCGMGAGMIGDRLDVDAFMDPSGVVMGTARFEDALGAVTFIPIDSMFGFGAGVLVQNVVSQDTVAIWIADFLVAPSGTSLVNVELPRGCVNTVSTFTPGVDKVTMQIKFR